MEIAIAQSVVITGEDDKLTLDGGKTWLAQAEFNAKYLPVKVEWWSYEEYKAWLENEKKELSQIIGDKGWNPTEGWYTWTQEKVDEAIARYEETLEDIKNGVLLSKSLDGNSDVVLSFTQLD
ncbi:hypothetical protein D1872_286180 [compost metagenome]